MDLHRTTEKMGLGSSWFRLTFKSDTDPHGYKKYQRSRFLHSLIIELLFRKKIIHTSAEVSGLQVQLFGVFSQICKMIKERGI